MNLLTNITTQFPFFSNTLYSLVYMSYTFQRDKHQVSSFFLFISPQNISTPTREDSIITPRVTVCLLELWSFCPLFFNKELGGGDVITRETLKEV